MKIFKKLGVFTLCLVLFCSLMTVGVAAEIVPTDYVVRNEFGLEAPLDISLLESLDELASSGTESFLIDVRDLAAMECYELVVYRGFEETVHGAIYFSDGAYYYLNYVNLGNQHFDANGYFSYRSGEVMLTRAETYRGGIEEALDPLTEEPWSGSAEGVLYDGKIAMVFFWIGFTLLGFVAPIPFFALGILFSRSKKPGSPKYWRILSYIAVAWFALSAVLLVMLLIV